MNKINKATICPQCNSTNYRISNNNEWITGQTRTYICNSCDFEALIFPQVNSDKISKLKKINKLDIPKEIESKKYKIEKINPLKLFIVLLFIFLTYTAYRFGLFDFAQSTHEHATNLFFRYGHIK